MQFTFALLAALVSAANAVPTAKRQSECPLQNVSSGLSVVTSTDPHGKIRWDVCTKASGLVQLGDLQWYQRGSTNNNEVFIAAVGSQPNLFTFQLKGGQPIGLSGSELLASDTAATFKVDCGGGCDSFASGGALAASGCTMEATNGTNGIGQCITYEAANSVVQLQECQSGNSGQSFLFFSV